MKMRWLIYGLMLAFFTVLQERVDYLGKRKADGLGIYSLPYNGYYERYLWLDDLVDGAALV